MLKWASPGALSVFPLVPQVTLDRLHADSWGMKPLGTFSQWVSSPP